jgi:hypothetical protein
MTLLLLGRFVFLAILVAVAVITVWAGRHTAGEP